MVRINRAEPIFDKLVMLCSADGQIPLYSADGQIPLYYEIIDVNRNDVKQVSKMLKNFHNFIKTSWEKNISH